MSQNHEFHHFDDQARQQRQRRVNSQLHETKGYEPLADSFLKEDAPPAARWQIQKLFPDLYT